LFSAFILLSNWRCCIIFFSSLLSSHLAWHFGTATVGKPKQSSSTLAVQQQYSSSKEAVKQL
jgi:hypothetical protein